MNEVRIGLKFDSLDKALRAVVTDIYTTLNHRTKAITTYIIHDDFNESGAKVQTGTTQAEIFFQSYALVR